MSRRILIIVATAVGMVLFVGCGGIASYFALDHSPVGDAVRDALGANTYDENAVEAALLTEADLPDYATDATQPGNNDAELTPCDHRLDLTSLGQAGTDRVVTLTKGDFGPVILHTTALMEEGATLEPIRNSLEDCPSWTQGNGDTYESSAADYGTYGDETYSVKLSIESHGVTVGLSVVFMRQGNLLSTVVVAGLPSVSDAEVSAVTAKAAAKLPD